MAAVGRGRARRLGLAVGLWLGGWSLALAGCYQPRALTSRAAGARAFAAWEARQPETSPERAGAGGGEEAARRRVPVAQAAARAVARSARVAALRLRARAARARAGGAWAWGDPELRVGLYELPRWAAGRSFASPALAEASGREVGPADVRVDLRVPLPNPWARSAEAARARARSAELEARARVAEAAVRAAVGRALIARWEAEGKARVWEDEVAALKALAARARAAVEAGAATALEGATVTLAGAAGAVEGARARARVAAAEAELEALVGAPVAAAGDGELEALWAGGEDAGGERSGLRALVREALGRRSEVAAAAARVEAARAALHGVVAAAWPWFGFVQGRVVARTSWPAAPGEVPAALGDAGVAVSLRVPLFRWLGLDGGEAAEARARVRAAEADARAVVDAVAGEVRRARAEVRAAREEAAVVARTVAPACDRAARALGAAEAQGRAPLGRAVDVARCRAQAGLMRLRARAAELRALRALRQAQGAP